MQYTQAYLGRRISAADVSQRPVCNHHAGWSGHGLVSVQQALAFGLAAGCLKHSIPGDFNRVSEDEVIELMEHGGAGRISR